MAKDKMHEFLNYQAIIIDNIEALKINLIECKDAGLEDIDDSLYNEIIVLEEETKAQDTDLGLSEVILRAQIIENKLDEWYSLHGISTLSLDWPDI